MVTTVKVTLVAPAATVALAGTVADALLDDRVRTAPPGGATPIKVTVAVAVPPPCKISGQRVSESSAGGAVMAREAVRLAPP